MHLLQRKLHLAINRLRLRRYNRLRRGHRAAKIELRESQVWCSAKIDLSRPKDCLRQEQIKPSLLGISRIEAVDQVRLQRHLALVGEQSAFELGGTTVQGRLIAYSPDSNLACGTAEAETDGYFDVDNVPPWDTWIALLDVPDAKYFESSLIAWVPEAFVPLVQAGIDVIPEDCVEWLDNCPAPLQRQWKRVAEAEVEEPALLDVL